MTSGKLHTKPDDNLKKHLAKRTRKIMIQSGSKMGRLTEAEKKTPSERKSIAMRKRLKRRD
jgi:hypothetical protein